ncbi:hypothetical protein HYV57_03700 [Candidatus Peregrinibacteria bacterium]|nr:hypothetical protein [Candidatus Peregrinibacteria bacterium]
MSDHMQIILDTSIICWQAGARRSDTRLDQKGRKFAKNAIGYAFFNAHFRSF